MPLGGHRCTRLVLVSVLQIFQPNAPRQSQSAEDVGLEHTVPQFSCLVESKSEHGQSMTGLTAGDLPGKERLELCP